ncbi:MAG TPA: ABC-F family ATP-binding cassette domain-containing protein [Clostridiales bacterium]|nr:ABC-F family ATP-binding cassette domain-containing protein [Clostridiales bacterium]
MIILSANNITKSFGIDIVLENVSFHINQGDKIGIVGANGAGKTTLLNILSGTLPFDSGDFFVSANTKIGYLRQSDVFESENTVYEEMLSIFSDLIDMENELELLSRKISEESQKGTDVAGLLHKYDDLMEAFKNKNGYGYKSEINGILNSMAFPEEYFDKRISILSGGERTRLALASLLLKKTDLLLLDEPTNHLDIGTLKWLEQYLKSYSGTIVVISHDRYFLDQMVNRVFEIENHKLITYEGNYSTYAKKKRQKYEDELRKYEHQQKEIQRQEDIIRRFKQHGTEKLAKRAQSREKRLKHIEHLERPNTSIGRIKVSFKQRYQSGNDVLLVKELSKSFGRNGQKRQLFRNVELDIKRGERICIVGPNGIGKTTLLKIIMGEIEPDQGYIKLGQNVSFGYYDQEQKLLNSANTVLEEVHSAYRLYSDTEIRSLLGRFLFRNDMVFQTVSSLSGGEKARLSLLKLMLSGANVLIMDEPTNHLDIASKEVFEEALLEFPGTMILVSHDRYFLNRVPTRIIELGEEGTINYLGGYDYYMEKKQSLGSGKSYLEDLGKTVSGSLKENSNDSIASNIGVVDISNSESGENSVLSPMETRRRVKEEQRQQKRLEKERKRLEEAIAETEGKIAWIENEMCKEEVYKDYKIAAKYQNDLDSLKRSLSEIYESWIALSD